MFVYVFLSFFFEKTTLYTLNAFRNHMEHEVTPRECNSYSRILCSVIKIKAYMFVSCRTFVSPA